MMINNQLTCLCGSQEFITYIEGFYDFFLVNNAPPFFQALRCIRCSLLVTNPPPSQHIAYMLAGQYAKFDEQDHAELIATSIYRFNKIQPLLQPQYRVLEIGCSSGKIVELINQCGIDKSIGVELYHPAVSYARQQGRDVIDKPLQECYFEDGYFNLIHAHHVLEHVQDLNIMLNEIWRILSREGILYITVPNYASPLVRSARWKGWFPQEHFWHFDKHTLTALLKTKGFRLLKLACPAHTDFAIKTGLKGTMKKKAKDILSKLHLGDTIEAWFQKVN